MRIILALLTVYLVWGSTYLATRFALEGGFPPFLLGGLRYLFAGILLYAALRYRGEARPTRTQWRHCAWMGLLLIGMGNGMVNIALQYVPSSITAVAVASSALWIAFFAALRGERTSRTETVGLIIGFAGIVLLNLGGELAMSRTGLITLLIAPIAWAFGSIWSRGRDLPSPFMAAAAQMLCGSVLMFPIALLRGEHFAAWPSVHGWLSFFYLVLFGSVLAYSAYVWLMANVRPALIGSYAYVNPAIAVMLGSWLAHEHLTSKDILAIIVILTGVITLTLHKTLRKKP